jgi:uncharacterized delta-60 repeat protein
MYQKTLFFALFLLYFGVQICFGQTWIKHYNGNANTTDLSRKVFIDNAGNSYITGFSTNIGSGRDVTTIKYNPTGVQQWVAKYNGYSSGNDEAYAITVDDAGNVYVAGTSYSNSADKDIILIKYNSGGSQQWASRYTSSGSYPDEAYAITLDNAGNPIIAGYSYGDHKGNQFIIIKYNTFGSQQWVSKYDGTSGNNSDEAYAITVDDAGNVYACGSSEGSSGNLDYVTIKYNSSGIEQWVKRYNGPGNNNDEAYAITLDDYGNVIVTGESVGIGTGQDYTTIKYNSSGVQQWIARYNNASANSTDIARAIIVANNKDVLVTGSSKSSSASGSEDYLTIRYDQNGDSIFVNRYNGSINSTDIAYSIVVPNSNNSVFITGSSKTSSGTGGEDIVTLKLNPSGNQIQKTTIYNPGSDAGLDVKLNSNEDIFLAGYMAGTGTGSDMTIAEYTGGSLITTISALTGNIPSSYNLYQNYPNPFNPSSVFKFDVPENSFIKISIYDALGRELFSPVNDYMTAGKYEITLTMNSFSSGIYFYKMTSGSFMDIKKMILVK